MTLDEFARIVADMRRSQKEYFRTRSQAAFIDSMRNERAVDKELKELLAGKQQGSLFWEANQ